MLKKLIVLVHNYDKIMKLTEQYDNVVKALGQLTETVNTLNDCVRLLSENKTTKKKDKRFSIAGVPDYQKTYIQDNILKDLEKDK